MSVGRKKTRTVEVNHNGELLCEDGLSKISQKWRMTHKMAVVGESEEDYM